MSDTDHELLRQFTRDHAQAAFTELVKRHVNLVYSAALRQVRSPQLAEEVAQSVFADLARDAAKLKPDIILTAWLYQVARRTAIDVVRKESRRQLREQIAVEMNHMNATAEDWTQIEPLLDAAMAALDETDRTAILLRYFENKTLREVGEVLGASDDAAQKRVSRAVEQLREFFTKRGATVGASGLAVAISANAVQAAPAGLAITISTAAMLAGTAIHTSTVIAATKTIAMTTLQKTLVTATIAVLAGAGIYEARQAAQLREQNQTLQQQLAPQAEQISNLEQVLGDLRRQVSALENQRFPTNSFTAPSAAPRMNFNREFMEAARKDAEARMALSQIQNASMRIRGQTNILENIARLKKYFEQMPQKKIPELQFLNDSDWINLLTRGSEFFTSGSSLETETDIQKVMSAFRTEAKRKFVPKLWAALDNYIKVSDGQLPANTLQLQSYFNPPIDEAILERYRMVQAGVAANLQPGEFVIEEKSAADTDYDVLYKIGLNNYISEGVGKNSSSQGSGHRGYDAQSNASQKDTAAKIRQMRMDMAKRMLESEMSALKSRVSPEQLETYRQKKIEAQQKTDEAEKLSAEAQELYNSLRFQNR